MDGTLSINSLLNANTKCQCKPAYHQNQTGQTRPLCRYRMVYTHLQNQYPSIQWRLDCNRQWTVHQLQRFWHACDPTND